jgi:MFS family permease
MKVAYKSVLKGAFLTVLTLFGGMLLGIILGTVVFESLPGHSVTNPSALHVTLGAVPAVTGLLVGAAFWGVLMGRFSLANGQRQMALAGILGFVPITIVLAFVLFALEGTIARYFGTELPIHRIFTLLFVPAAFLIAGTSAWALGRGLQDPALARRLMWQVGLAAALAFLLVNVVMEATGWIVGAPGAAERATMLVVMFAGNLGAALAGGGLLGFRLSHK